VLVLRRLGLECLAARRAGLATVIARLRAAGPSEVRTAVVLVHRLDNVDECADVGALAAELAIRAVPSLLEARAAAERTEREAVAAEDAGRYADAAQLAARAVELARPVGGGALARALVRRAELAQLAEGFRAAEAAYREAITVAERAHTDEYRALAMAGLMGVRAREPGHERDALAMRSLVDAAIARSGKRAVLAPLVDQAAGTAHLRLGRLADAVASFEAALAAVRAALPPGDPRLPEYIYPVGLALSHQRKDREALRYHEEAYRVAVGAWGAGHPNAERFAINLAVKHASLGDCKLALVELARARASLAAVLPADSAELVSIGEITGTCHTLQGNHAEALREHGEVQRVLIAAGREKSPEMGQAWLDIGDAHLDRGDVAQAAAAFEKSIATYEPLVGTDDVRLALPLAHLGDAEERAGRIDSARSRLERALALFTSTQAPALTAADARFPLARTLWARPADRVRARELAEAARAAYATGGPIFARRLAEVDAWLRDHGLRTSVR
jgi:tetratricopeptide (TPR) repeat protein